MKGLQSKVKWGEAMGAQDVNGGGGMPPPIITPLLERI